MTLTRTSETLPKKRYGPDARVVFSRGVRSTNEYDAETEEWAAEHFDELEIEGADADAQSAEPTVEDEAARVVSEMEADEADESAAEVVTAEDEDESEEADTGEEDENE